MAGTMYDGKFWDVSKTETDWVLSFQRKGSMYPIVKRVPLADNTTIAQAVATLDAQDIAQAEAQRATVVAKAAQTAPAIVQPAARAFCRCRRCRATGLAGSYPFSNGAGSLCDDCGL
jgi:hypothetical protein